MYQHRNGSTEPPELPGWYWFDGEVWLLRNGGEWAGMKPGLCCVPDCPHNGYGGVPEPFITVAYFRFDEYPYELAEGDRLHEWPLPKLRGRWWGPLTPPWEAPDDDANSHQL